MLYFKNSTFGVIISWSGRINILLMIGGSCRLTENGPVDMSVSALSRSLFLQLLILYNYA